MEVRLFGPDDFDKFVSLQNNTIIIRSLMVNEQEKGNKSFLS